MSELIPVERIADKILLIRGQKVMIDRDLAILYGVETRYLKQAVRRNIERFPDDFMFELTWEEYGSLRSQNVTLKRGEHSKYLPFAFTELGVAMLSSVLRSKRAIEINILIMRAFVRLRELLATNRELALRVERLEREMRTQGESLTRVVEIVTQLLEPPEGPKRRIGFQLEEKDDED